MGLLICCRELLDIWKRWWNVTKVSLILLMLENWVVIYLFILPIFITGIPKMIGSHYENKLCLPHCDSVSFSVYRTQFSVDIQTLRHFHRYGNMELTGHAHRSNTRNRGIIESDTGKGDEGNTSKHKSSHISVAVTSSSVYPVVGSPAQTAT